MGYFSNDLDVIAGDLFIVLGTIALLLNSLLILVASRIKNLKREIVFVIILAVVDMIYPGITVIAFANVLRYGKDLEKLDKACDVKGPIDFISLYLSMTLVAIIAIQRCSRVFSFRSTNAIYSALGIHSVLYIGIVIYAAFIDKYHIAPSGVDCATLAHEDSISKFIVFELGLSLLLLLLITLFCYIKILLFALSLPAETPDIIERNNYLNLHPVESAVSETRRRILQPVKAIPGRDALIIRTLLICFIYAGLVIPPAVFLILEATIILPISSYLSLVISALLFFCSVTNPCMVLFAHSIIYHQLQDMCSNMVSRIKSLISQFSPSK